MLQVGFIKANKEKVIEGLKKRNLSDFANLDEVIQLDEKRKATQTELNTFQAESNQISKEIGMLYKQGKRDEAEGLKAKVADGKEKVKELEQEMSDLSEKIENILLQIPNVPHSSVPPGTTEEDNEVFRAWPNALPEFPETAKPHWELAKDYNLFSLELGTKIAGAGFPLYRGKGAKLQRALISFFLDENIEAGYEEILPPHLVNEATARGTGQLPDKEGQMYYVTKDDLYLLPTAEVPVTNIYRNEILKPEDLPIMMTAYTPCFRREAGSYGAHVRGLNRVHQFDKVEIVRMELPENSYAALDGMLEHVARILDKLELPYRILRLCGGDVSFASALTYDFEIWSAAQKRWLEVSSVSNFETFQSNRLKLRYRDGKKTELAHTLNGSSLALARIVAGLLENNQTPEGIKIPKALQRYTGFEMID